MRIGGYSPELNAQHQKERWREEGKRQLKKKQKTKDHGGQYFSPIHMNLLKGNLKQFKQPQQQQLYLGWGWGAKYTHSEINNFFSAFVIYRLSYIFISAGFPNISISKINIACLHQEEKLQYLSSINQVYKQILFVYSWCSSLIT